MPKVFITGSGGVGKSTVIRRLRERGHTAYDTDDMPETTRLEDINGHPVKWPDGYVDWKKYRWNWQREAIEKLLSSDTNVFIGAFPGNWKKFVKDFDVIIVLSIEPKEHEHRLRTRNVHTHAQGGKNIFEQVYAEKQHLKSFLASGAKKIINDRPVDEIVDEILSYVD